VVLFFDEALRHGTTLRLARVDGRPAFVPATALAVTVVGLAVAWCLVAASAAAAGRIASAAGGLVFLVANAGAGRPRVLLTAGVDVLRVGPSLGRVAYLLAGAALVVGAALPSGARRALGGVAVGAIAVFFGALLIVHGAAV